MATMRLVLLFHECNGLFAIVIKDDNPDIFMGLIGCGVCVVIVVAATLTF